MKFNLDIPKMGYILAVRRGKKDFIGAGIQEAQIREGYSFEDSCYTHVEIVGGGDRSMRIMPPRAKSINITEFYQSRYVKLLRYDHLEFENRFRKSIAYEYAMLCNIKYDIRAIFAFIFKFITQDKRKNFCSEGVCTAFQHYVPDAFNGIEPDKCFPATIVSDSKTIVVWEGYIS